MEDVLFNHFLRQINVDNDIRSIFYHIARSVKKINSTIRSGNTIKIGNKNPQGEEQIQIDILSDKIIERELEKSELVCTSISEEQENSLKFKAPRGKFTVAYDPLDGSSLVDANLSIGSIFGIWTDCGLVGRKGSDQLAACYALYGPRVILVVAIKDKGVHEFEMNDIGEFVLTRENIKIRENTKYFAPGNLRATKTNNKYLKLVGKYIEEGRTLRYSGGMVPDLHHILSKGEGIFCYPADEKHTNGKLRLTFECAPFSFIFQEAGGLGLTQNNENVLNLKIANIHERTTIFIGSKNEVKKAVKYLS